MAKPLAPSEAVAVLSTAGMPIHCSKDSPVLWTLPCATSVWVLAVGTHPMTLASEVSVASLVTSTKVSSDEVAVGH